MARVNRFAAAEKLREDTTARVEGARPEETAPKPPANATDEKRTESAEEKPKATSPSTKGTDAKAGAEKTKGATPSSKKKAHAKRGEYFKPGARKVAKISISTTEEIKDLVDKKCREEGRNRSMVVSDILAEYFGIALR